MAATSREPAGDLTQDRILDLLRTEPHSFGFFQMVRLLEKLHRSSRSVGSFVSPAEETVRFSSFPSQNFPASEIQSYAEGERRPGKLEVNFVGLNVVNGPMPVVYAAALRDRERQKDRATLDFFDIFNHRIVSLFYRAWKKYRFHIAYESTGTGEDEITRCLYDLVGLGTPDLRNRMAIADEAAIYYAGILGRSVRSVEGLRQILEDYFGVPIEIAQFTGRWERLPRSQQTVLNETSSFSESLGRGTVVGDEVWNQQGTLTVRLGPMPLARYRQFLPGAQAQKELHAWLRFYARGEFDFVVQLVLDRSEVPHTALPAERELSPRLGYESWLKAKPFTRDPDETTYVVE
jgi:type VI secretion system protein ImpH